MRELEVCGDHRRVDPGRAPEAYLQRVTRRGDHPVKGEEPGICPPSLQASDDRLLDR